MNLGAISLETAKSDVDAIRFAKPDPGEIVDVPVTDLAVAAPPKRSAWPWLLGALVVVGVLSSGRR